MKIFNDLAEWQLFRHALAKDISLGFVPTMGNLHQGHASLMQQSKQENDITLASIFINPTQFNQQEDFIHYPRTLDADLEILQQCAVDYCLLPQDKQIYADDFRFQIHDMRQLQRMEAHHRPGHFTGVLTIVMKLLTLVRPHRAYFGEKDYQQFQLIRDMVSAFFMGIDVKACPTIRETSGLAYSSRNNRLSTEQRLRAEAFAQTFHQSSMPISQVLNALEKLGITVEYLEEHDNRRFVSVYIDNIRLIDNYALVK